MLCIISNYNFPKVIDQKDHKFQIAILDKKITNKRITSADTKISVSAT